MILHQRKPDIELLFFRALNHRSTLSTKDEAKLNRLEKGYTGELIYDKIYDQVINHLYTFRNIYLKIEDTTLQIDSLIVTDYGLIVHEIKNFQGLYEIINNKWTIRQSPLSNDPIIQLKRTTNKLHSLNYTLQENMSILGKLVFPNIEFNIESHDKEILEQIIIRSQLRRYFHELKGFTSTEKANFYVNYIAENIIENPFFNRKVNITDVKKGVYCLKCNSFNMKKLQFHFKCQDCQCMDTIQTHILRTLSDYNALFYKEPITLSRLYEFIDGSVSKRSLIRVLSKYCTKTDLGRGSTYTFNYHDFEEALTSTDKKSRYFDYSRLELVR